MELKFDRARFDAGEMPTRTRDGRKVLHVHDSGLGRDFPLVAWIEGRLGCDEFTADGRYQVYGEGPHDLIHEPQKVRVGLRRSYSDPHAFVATTRGDHIDRWRAEGSLVAEVEVEVGEEA